VEQEDFLDIRGEDTEERLQKYSKRSPVQPVSMDNVEHAHAIAVKGLQHSTQIR
jgi:hypothetical protein